MSADPLGELFGSIAGHRIDGGCDDCRAFRTLTEVMPGVWKLLIHHDDTCPYLRAIDAEAN